MTIPASQYSVKFFQKTRIIRAQNVLVTILAIAVVLRAASALLLGNTVTQLPGTHDQISYDSLAQRVVGGYGFSFAENHWPMTRAGEPTAHWSFFYTAYLSVLYALFGHQPLIPRLLQAILVGVLHTYITYLLAEKTFTRTVGLIAAAISALYVYFIYYSGALMTEPFYITAIVWSLFFAMRIAENDNRRGDLKLGIGLGVVLAITVLLRQVFLLFIPFLFLWIWITRFKRRLGLPIVSTILSFTIIILCILPISLYNQSRFGRFVLLNTNSGYAFFLGNHPIYGTRFVPILTNGEYHDMIPEEVRHLDEAALDQELLERGMQFVFDDPKRYILLSISRIPAYFMFWPSADSSLVSNISRVASFGVMLPFMIYGLILAIRNAGAEKGHYLLNLLASPVGLLLLFSAMYTAVHLLTWALIRYRLPVDAVLIPFAALATVNIFENLQRKNIIKRIGSLS